MVNEDAGGCDEAALRERGGCKRVYVRTALEGS